ncbi:hypothetical protein BST91_04815 [Nonlabens tegetincola]|uniref:beta strand repeat-containing protein n=1 Tax=Nonlabens tegetincola TaxID=323273 RepID=UPI000A206360|nr:hypothetical protein [Nonlabens tegetincola]ARN71017.1 hypothetical protein BST91_04815 [Nonlabens tegetincola]
MNGTYTFTNNDGTDVTIDTNGIVITNVIAGNRIATVTEADGTAVDIDETITTITGNAATGNTIATYENENGDTEDINETVTALGINAGELTYANEDATNANVNLISADADNSITAGTDGALFVDVSAAQTVTNLTDLNDGFVTYTNEDGTVQTVAKADITDNMNGTYTFTNNDGTDVTIDTNGIVITNVIAGNRIATVTEADGTAVDIDETITTITGNAATGNTIATYENENGDTEDINETVTALGINAGELTYANEDATNANVNLISADADNSITAGTDGALFVDVSAAQTVTNLTDLGNGFVTYTNEDGTVQTVAKADITDNMNGTYTFTNNDGTDVTIDTNGIVITNVIAGNRIATVTEADGTAVDIDETITTITGNAATGNTIATYENENGDTEDINETVTALGINAGELIYANEDATNANVNLISADADNSITAGTDGALFVDVSAAQTVTNLTDLGNGFVTYTNEDGTVQTVAKADITDNMNGTYTFTNNDGTDVTIDTNGIVITNVIAGNRIATVTEADGTAVDIDETITTITGNAATGNTIATYENENGDTEDINETVTALGINAGELTYANEDATNANVNLISADADNSITAGTDGALFVDVSAAQTVTNLTDLNDGFVTYTNEDGTVQTVAKADITDNMNGTYTFTNNDGTDVTIDTNGIVITNVIAGNRIATVTEADGTAVDIDETITTITGNAATGNTIATYENENGDTEDINETVTALGINAGELTYANEDATNANVNLISTDADNSITAGTDGALFVDVSAAQTVTNLTDLGNGFVTYTNEDGTVQTVAKADITDNMNGTYTFTNNDGTDVTIDTNGIVITNVIAGNRIATVTEADGTAVDIDETITTITGNAATGNTIATYENENGDTEDINETVTALGINAGELTYANEDATNANVNLISADADNSITAGTDGALFVDVSAAQTVTNLTDLNDGFVTYTNEDGTVQTVAKADITDNMNGTYTFTNNDGTDVTIDTNGIVITNVIAGNRIATVTEADGTAVDIDETVTTFSQNDTPTSSDPNATGEITFTNEAGTTTTAQVVSADANNSIQVGSDGGAYFVGPTIAAAGNVAGDGSTITSFGTSSITRLNTGDYRINFTTPITTGYVIQLTVLDCNGNCPPAGGSNYDDPGISYYGNDANGFNVNIGDSDNGASPKVDIDLDFMFTIIKLP